MIKLCVSQLYQNFLEKKIVFINTLSPDIFGNMCIRLLAENWMRRLIPLSYLYGKY